MFSPGRKERTRKNVINVEKASILELFYATTATKINEQRTHGWRITYPWEFQRRNLLSLSGLQSVLGYSSAV